MCAGWWCILLRGREGSRGMTMKLALGEHTSVFTSQIVYCLCKHFFFY